MGSMSRWESTATGCIADYPAPRPSTGPHGIVVGVDGAVRDTAISAGRTGRLDPRTAEIREYLLPDAARDPHGSALHEGKVRLTARMSDRRGGQVDSCPRECS